MDTSLEIDLVQTCKILQDELPDVFLKYSQDDAQRILVNVSRATLPFVCVFQNFESISLDVFRFFKMVPVPDFQRVLMLFLEV